MFNVTLYYNEDDFGGLAGTEMTVFESLATDTEVLHDLYGSQMIHAPKGENTAMECETCATTVLVVERGVFGGPIITEFKPFGVDDGDNGSGVIQCSVCMLKGAHYGQSVIGQQEGAEGRGAHRLAV